MNKIKKINRVKALTPKKLAEFIKSDTESFTEYQDILVQRKERVNLIKVDLSHSSVNQCTFRLTDFSESRMVFGDFKGCTFVECNLDRSVLHGAEFEGCFFIRCSITDSNWKNCKLTNCSFFDCNLHKANIDHAELSKCILKRSDFTEVDFGFSTFENCIIIGSVLKDISLQGVLDIESNIFSECPDLPRSISTALDMQLFELTNQRCNKELSREELIKKINSKKLETRYDEEY